MSKWPIQLSPKMLALLVLLSTTVTQANPPGSHSLGDASHGSLVHGKAIALKTATSRVLPATVKRGFYYGTEELVDALQTVALHVRNLHSGSTVRLGNLSRQQGGDIPQSRSHNSGRDADIAYFFRDAKKRDAQPGTLLRVAQNGQTLDGTLTFDVERNWALVDGLLADTRIHVQWIFCAGWLRKALLEFADSHGVSPQTRIRIETLVKQPSDSAPHDDHFHLRIYCSQEDRLHHGCVDYGARWPWIPNHSVARSILRRELQNTALDSTANLGDRKEALQRLVSSRSRASVPPLLPLLTDADLGGDVLNLIVRTRAVETIPLVITRLRQANNPTERATFIEALAKLGTKETVPPLAASLSQEDLPISTRSAALQVLVRLRAGDAVPIVLSLLSSADENWQQSLLEALGRITNHNPDSAGDWHTWWEKHKNESSTQWLTNGYLESGCAACATGPWAHQISALIGVIQGPPQLSWNARQKLRALTGNGTNTADWSPKKAHRYWSRWWKRAEKRYGG